MNLKKMKTKIAFVLLICCGCTFGSNKLYAQKAEYKDLIGFWYPKDSSNFVSIRFVDDSHLKLYFNKNIGHDLPDSSEMSTYSISNKDGKRFLK